MNPLRAMIPYTGFVRASLTPLTTTIKLSAPGKTLSFCFHCATVQAGNLWMFAAFSPLKLALFCLWPFPSYCFQDQYAFYSRSDYFSPCQLTLTSPVIPPSIFNVIFSFSPLISCAHLKSLLSTRISVSLSVTCKHTYTHYKGPHVLIITLKLSSSGLWKHHFSYYHTWSAFVFSPITIQCVYSSFCGVRYSCADFSLPA